MAKRFEGPWTKVHWSDFRRHFSRLSDAEIVADIRAGLDLYDRQEEAHGETDGLDIGKDGSFFAAMMRAALADIETKRRIGSESAAKRWNSAQSKCEQSKSPSAGSPIGDDGSVNRGRESGSTEHLDSSADGSFYADEAPLPKRECDAPHRIPAKVAKAEPKVATGDLANVYLTATEARQLAEKLGPERAAAYVTSLSLYKGKTGKTYRSDYAAVLSWSRKDEAQGVAADGHKMTQRERLAKYCDDRRRRAGLARHPGTIAPEPAHATDPPKAILPPEPVDPIPEPPKAIAPPAPPAPAKCRPRPEECVPLDDFEGMPEEALDDIFGAMDGRRSREDERNDIFRDYT